MARTTIQNSLVAGEMSPSLFGRTDLAKYHNGASTMRNGFVSYRGGYYSRAGDAYVGTCLQDGNGLPPRDIDFQFSLTQGYALEFGDHTVGPVVTGTANNGSGAIRLAVVSTRGLMTGLSMVVASVGGTVEANGTWPITVVDSTHVDLVGSTYTNPYTSGGTTSTVAGYMRVKSNGAYVIESTKAITGATQANPCVLHVVAHGYAIGDWVYIAGMGGMPNFNGLTWIVATVPDADHITLKDLFGNVVSASAFTAYTSGGTTARLFTLATPYMVADIPYLKFTQSADTMTLCCVNPVSAVEYISYELVRLAADNWTLTADDFAVQITAPTGVTVTPHNSTTTDTYYSYVVTAVSASGEESVASAPATAQNNDISVFAGSNTIGYSSQLDAVSYNIYRATPSYSVSVPIGSQYYYVGTAYGTQFTDTNIISDATKSPPLHRNPFARGTIAAVDISSGGSGFTQAGVGYTVNTSTGSGFVGSPVVVSGSVVAFIVENGGENYDPSDTITLTGGNAGGKAAGSYLFNPGNPTNGQTIILNGVTWTFTTGVPGVTSTKIGATLALTLAALAGDLGVSANASLSVASYSVAGSNLQILYNTAGVGGNAYTLAAGTYAGTISGATLTGGGASPVAATLVVGPETGTYPSVPAYYQQRRVYADTLNLPDTYFMSKPGLYTNMDTSNPPADDDAITGNPWSQQINGIQFMVPMTSGLIMLTGNGAWNVSGSNNAAITPADQSAQSQAYNGCNNHVPPIVVNYDILYVQSKGSIVRDLAYNFFVNVYTGTDTTVLSSHLFTGYTIEQWAYAEEPYKLIWAIRNDGRMLSLTYLKEQDVYGWARHDTNGLYKGVCSVTEPPVDAIYLIVQRYVNGQWKYYSERMNDRIWPDVEDCWCVDAGLGYPMTYPSATLMPAAADGTANISSVNIAIGGSGYTAPIIRAVNPEGFETGSGATFSCTLSMGSIIAITPLTEGTGYVGGTTLEISDLTGIGAVASPVITNYINFTASAAIFSAANIGDVIRAGGGKATVISYTSPTVVVANVTQAIAEIMPNDPNEMPIPQTAGNWSMTAPTDTVTGLNHLIGMQVAILADGSVVPNQTVVALDDGRVGVVLTEPSSQITVGLPFLPQLQTLYLDVPTQEGSIQSKRKNINSVAICMESSRGMSVGTNQPDASVQPNNANVPWEDMTEFKDRDALVEAGSSIPLFTGYEFINVGSNWDTAGQIALQQEYPLPMNVLAVVAYYNLGDT